jgi:hypothetical protein
MRGRLNAQQADRPIVRAATSAALNCQASANRRPLVCRERARDRATAAREDDDSRTYVSVDNPMPLRPSHSREAPESQRWWTGFEMLADHVSARFRAEYRGVDPEVVDARQVDGLLPQADGLRH